MALAVAVMTAVAVASLGATRVRHDVAPAAADGSASAPRSGSPTPQAAGLGLPTLGSSQVVETDDVGDPFVLTLPAGVDGRPDASYVLYWTTDWNSNVPTAVSTDLVHWRRVPDALPALPSWALLVRPPPSWPSQ